MLVRIPLCVSSLLLIGALGVFAQDLSLPALAFENDASVTQAMPVLAKQAIAAFQEPDREKFLSTVFRLQMVAGEFSQASGSLTELIALRS